MQVEGLLIRLLSATALELGAVSCSGFGDDFIAAFDDEIALFSYAIDYLLPEVQAARLGQISLARFHGGDLKGQVYVRDDYINLLGVPAAEFETRISVGVMHRLHSAACRAGATGVYSASQMISVRFDEPEYFADFARGAYPNEMDRIDSAKFGCVGEKGPWWGDLFIR